MEHIMCAIEIIIFIILPIWIYLWFNKRIKNQLSHYLGLDIQFALKRWWAHWCISKEKKSNRDRLSTKEIMSRLKNMLKPCTDNSKIIIDDSSCDSISFYGADQKGNSLFVKMNHTGLRLVELALQMTLSDGRVYVLPDYPHTVTTDGTGQKWSASGLKIELLEGRKRWRIAYNGFLRNQCLGDISNDNNVEHIRLNFIFIGNSRPLEWPNDWSTHLHADALAHEPWKSPDWRNKIKLINHTGFDQWGSGIGQITFKDSTVNTLYFRGICQRRWGKHESYQFYRTVTFYGTTTTGAMYCIGVSKTKNSFSHMQFGHIKQSTGTVSKIDWTDLKLTDFGKQDYIPANYNIMFKADNKKFNAIINYTGGNTINCYNGQPWRWMITTRNLHIQLNGNKGVGLMIICSTYNGPNEMKIPLQKIPVTKIQHLKRPETFAQDSYVVHFADKQCQNESIVGGKGYSLAVLTSITNDNFIIPQGFCVTTLAFERQLQHHQQLRDMIADIIDIIRGKKNEDLKSYCEKIVSVIQTTPVEEQIKKAILEALEKMESTDESDTNIRGQCFAIRSSAVGEDSEETSAAGQNSTYLGINNAEDIVKSIAKCWASLFSYQSVEYRRQNGLPIKASMGVCIQRMIDAEAAGVMFTRHPTTGDPSNIIITANYGLGETVVSGMVEPDTLTVHKKWDNTLIVDDSVLGNKGKKISLCDNGVTISNLDEEEIQKISISNATALQLAEIGLRLESFFGSARDIEWAIVGEQIYLLQARPITINAWTDFELIHELDSGVPADIDLMSFANIEEIFPYPVSPLSITSLIRVLNLSLAVKCRELDCDYIHTVATRCAINYSLTSLRIVNKEITMSNKMADMAICGRVIMTPELHKTVIKKFGTTNTWEQIYHIFDMFKTIWTHEKILKETIDMHRKYKLNATEFDTAHDLYNVLNKKYREIFIAGHNHTHVSRVSICYQIISMSLLTAGSKEITQDHLADIATLLSSCTNVISTEVPIALGKIAACIRKNGKAKDFNDVEPAKAMEWLKSNCPPAAEKLRAFFDMHGHRCIQELDLLSEPWIFKPDSIINTIQALAISVEETHVSKTLSIQETIASLKTPISSSTKWLLQKIIPLCRKAVARREMTKNLVVSIIHILRLAYRRLGALMVAEDYIPDQSLIFFLTHQEIGQLLNSSQNLLLVRKALRRRRIHHQLQKVKYPEFSTGMPVPIQDIFDPSSYKDCTKIEGTSVCGGSVMARVCVITTLSEAKKIKQGDILITHCTDIGWSPYFPLLSGVITELGGLISHGAVVAREYGLPCIVGAKNATQIFQTGDIVLLAGDIGVLQLVKKKTD